MYFVLLLVYVIGFIGCLVGQIFCAKCMSLLRVSHKLTCYWSVSVVGSNQLVGFTTRPLSQFLLVSFYLRKNI